MQEIITDIDSATLFGRASSLQLAGKLSEAAAIYRVLQTRSPNDPKVLNNLGRLAIEAGNPEGGLRFLERSLQIDPAQPAALFNMGDALRRLGRNGQALAHFNRVLALRPNHAVAHFNCALVLSQLKDYRNALVACERAIALSPGTATFHNVRGNLLVRSGRADEALTSFDRAIEIKSDFADAHSNRGLLLQSMNRIEEAAASMDRAIELNPNLAPAYLNKALLLLAKGDYESGWMLHEWRRKCAPKKYDRTFTQPLWLGDQPLAGKTLLVFDEAWFGDMLQFCRYVPMIEALGAKVILQVPQPLVELMKTLSQDVVVVANGEPLPDFDYQCPIMSLPLAFKTTLKTVPKTFPYLHSDEDRREQWQQTLSASSTYKVGLSWSGRAGAEIDLNPNRRRSVELDQLRPLFELPAEFHVLQKEIDPADLAALAEIPNVHVHMAEIGDFADTAALIDNMDLVLTIDTSVAHLAGALGKRLWIMLPVSTDYRWTIDGFDSPWYPEATLFRQTSAGEWSMFLAGIAMSLRDEIRGRQIIAGG